MPENMYTIHGVDVYPSDVPGSYRFLPRVLPETTPSGDPQMLLMRIGDTGLLQMGAQFTVEPAVLEQVRASLMTRHDPPVPIVLVQAPLTVRSASVVLRTGEADQVLTRSDTSGMAPYTAVFRVPLTSKQMDAVEAAVQGSRGRLIVSYDVAMSAVAGARVQLRGDVMRLLHGVEARPDEALAADVIERGIQDRIVTLGIEEWGVDVEAVTEVAIAAAKAKGALLLASMEWPLPLEPAESAATLTADIRIEEPRTIDSRREGDVADWFAGRAKPVIRSGPHPGAPPPAGHTVTCRLGFDPGDLPLAFVELTGSGQAAVLRGPAWHPVTLQAGAQVTLTARYTSGSPPFTTPIDTTGPERVLQMEDVGITEVMVDASARKAAGAKQMRVNVTYLRDGTPEEQWPVMFRYGEWINQQSLVTQARGLNGLLEYDWQETSADGAVTTGGPVRTDTPTIRIV